MPKLKVPLKTQKDRNFQSILRYHMAQMCVSSLKKAGALSGIGENIMEDRYACPEKLRLEELRKLKAYFHLSDEELAQMI